MRNTVVVHVINYVRSVSFRCDDINKLIIIIPCAIRLAVLANIAFWEMWYVLLTTIVLVLFIVWFSYFFISFDNHRARLVWFFYSLQQQFWYTKLRHVLTDGVVDFGSLEPHVSY